VSVVVEELGDLSAYNVVKVSRALFGGVSGVEDVDKFPIVL